VGESDLPKSSAEALILAIRDKSLLIHYLLAIQRAE
jgi:hypothetical protein